MWWGFGDDQTLWKKTQSSIYELFTTSTYADVAPFVVHSASFGSEPIGDGVDGSNFISDLTAFRKQMNEYGIPVGISEDWDRDSMRSGEGLGEVGKQVVANTDIVHAHSELNLSRAERTCSTTCRQSCPTITLRPSRRPTKLGRTSKTRSLGSSKPFQINLVRSQR